jgi:hypothetical protein
VAYLTAAEVKTLIGSKAANWDNTRIANLVARFEEMVEDYLGCAYQERTRTWTVRDRTRWRYLQLPDPFVREVSAVSIDGTADTEDQITAMNSTLAGDVGVVTRDGGWMGLASITYTHGLDLPPQALLDACVDYVRVKYLAQTSSRARNIESYEDDSGFSYTVGRADPANGRPTGIPPVDDAINEVPSHAIPGIA